jgi:phosphate transport system substrate-binding protein
LLFFTNVQPASAASHSISVKGSDTMLLLTQKWVHEFSRRHSDVAFQISGGGSGIGFAALQNNTTDLCAASRPIKPTEVLSYIKAFSAAPTEYKVCLDAIAVYVHPDNPIQDLDLNTLRDIYAGRISNWREVGGKDQSIILYSRENSSGTYEFFKSSIMQHEDFSPATLSMPGTSAVMQAVAKDAGGIGYGGAVFGAVVKTIGVRASPSDLAIKPNAQSVQKGEYPIWRYLYHYVNPAMDQGMLGDYLKWIRSSFAQSLAEESGYFPLPGSVQVTELADCCQKSAEWARTNLAENK